MGLDIGTIVRPYDSDAGAFTCSPRDEVAEACIGLIRQFVSDVPEHAWIMWLRVCPQHRDDRQTFAAGGLEMQHVDSFWEIGRLYPTNR